MSLTAWQALTWTVLAGWLAVVVGGGASSLESMRAFAQRVRTIATAEELGELKRVVGQRMRFAFRRALVAAACLTYFLVGMQTPTLTSTQIWMFAFAGLATIALGVAQFLVKRTIKRIPVGDAALAEEHAAVLDAWNRRFLPPW